MLRYGTEHNLYIRQSEVRVQDDDPLPHFPELDSQIDGGIGLSHAALAAGDGNDTGQGFGLLLACL